MGMGFEGILPLSEALKRSHGCPDYKDKMMPFVSAFPLGHPVLHPSLSNDDSKLSYPLVLHFIANISFLPFPTSIICPGSHFSVNLLLDR